MDSEYTRIYPCIKCGSILISAIAGCIDKNGEEYVGIRCDTCKYQALTGGKTLKESLKYWGKRIYE